MAGKPFKVARFAHTLRIRLMREHVGVDVDTISQADSPSNSYKHPYDQEAWDSDDEQQHGGNWSLPTPTPKINPQGFEDPISDSFWKKVWLACAAHNVSPFLSIQKPSPDLLPDSNLSQSISCCTGRSHHHMETIQGVCCLS